MLEVFRGQCKIWFRMQFMCIVSQRVNLVLVNVCKNEPIARDFFYLVQSLYVYMSSAVPHANFCATQAGMDYSNVVIELKRIIDTHWTCQYASITSIKKTYIAILKTLEELSVVRGDRAVSCRE